jgi:hypothetical protein
MSGKRYHALCTVVECQALPSVAKRFLRTYSPLLLHHSLPSLSQPNPFTHSAQLVLCCLLCTQQLIDLLVGLQHV